MTRKIILQTRLLCPLFGALNLSLIVDSGIPGVSSKYSSNSVSHFTKLGLCCLCTTMDPLACVHRVLCRDYFYYDMHFVVIRTARDSGSNVSLFFQVLERSILMLFMFWEEMKTEMYVINIKAVTASDFCIGKTVHSQDSSRKIFR